MARPTVAAAAQSSRTTACLGGERRASKSGSRSSSRSTASRRIMLSAEPKDGRIDTSCGRRIEEHGAKVLRADTLRLGTWNRRSDSTVEARTESQTKVGEIWRRRPVHSREVTPTPSQGGGVKSPTAAEVESGARRGIAMAGAQIEAHTRSTAPAEGSRVGPRRAEETGAQTEPCVGNVGLVGAGTGCAKGHTAPRRAIRASPAPQASRAPRRSPKGSDA